MNNNMLALSSLSSDLLHVAKSLHRKSYIGVQRFFEEARKRLGEIDFSHQAPYVRKILILVAALFSSRRSDRTAEDALMYSQLIQNYVVYYETTREKVSG